MSLSKNGQEVKVIGHLGGDPTMRYIPSGTAVTTFSVASTKKWTDNSGQQMKVTTWWKVTTWGKLAEVCNQYLKKGSKVLVEGEMSPDPATGGPKLWTTSEGETRASYEITCSDILFLSSNKDGHEGGSTEEEGAPTSSGRAPAAARPAATSRPTETFMPPLDDDIPF